MREIEKINLTELLTFTLANLLSFLLTLTCVIKNSFNLHINYAKLCSMNRVNYIIFMILIAITVSFVFQGKRGLYSPDEGRYTECAREMFVSHNYIVPKLNGELHLSKPPITYWSIALSLKFFGKNEFAARFPNSFFFFLTIILIFLIAKNLWNIDIGILAGLIYSTSIFTFAGMNFITTDTILTFFIWLYIYFFIKKSYNLMWLSMGLAFMTKGPPSLLPFLGILCFLIFKDKKNFKDVFTTKGILSFLLIGFSWYILIVIKYPEAFNYFLNKELIGRITGIHHRNSGFFDWIIYLPIILFGLFPWCLYWIKINYKKLEIDKNVWLLLFIFFIPLIIFFIARSRLPLYILPLFPCMSILTAYFLKQTNIKIPMKYFIITAITLVIARFSFSYIPDSKNEKLLFNKIKNVITVKNANLFLITSRNHFGLNFYFNKIIQHLNFKDKKLNQYAKQSITEALNNLKTTDYFIIFDKEKLQHVTNILKEFRDIKYLLIKRKGIFIIKAQKI